MLICKSVRYFLLIIVSTGFVFFANVLAAFDDPYNMPRGVTEISKELYGLHMFVIYVCIAIAIVVFGAMFWSLIAHRKRSGYKGSSFHESWKLEIVWTIIPIIILVVLAVPATRVLFKMYDTSAADLDIKVTGYQWKWQYEYLGEDVSFFSNLSTSAEEISNQQRKNADYLLEVDNPLIIPVGKKVRFLLTANDVIHSWWVPELGVKKDAIPGFINETWAKVDKPGIYRGQCAELCGKNHGFMPIVVEARTQSDFDQWFREKKAVALAAKAAEAETIWDKATLINRGKAVYLRNCAACHMPAGTGLPPTFPALVDNAVVSGEAESHIDVLVHGRQGTAMQAFGKQLSDADIASVITYTRNIWGNQNKGIDKVVLPEHITTFKQNNR